MKKALRIGYNRYYRDDIFEEHLKFIKKNISAIDEITLFAEFCHYGYWDIDYSAENAKLLKDRISQYRKAGVKSVGINLLCTIGHAQEGWSVLPKPPFPFQEDEHGTELRGHLCINNDAYLDYIAKRYALYADTGADFIWMDDDIRLDPDCCCSECIHKFNEIYKTDYNREELVADIRNNQNVSNQWTRFKTDVIIKLIGTIRTAVKNTNPKVKIGFMSISRNAIREWILESGAEKARPGEGFFDERQPVDVFEKCFRVQKQITNYPEEIKDIQYEYEAFNYQSLNRSVKFSELETTLALMSGCSGVLYNNDIFNDRQELLDMLTSSAKKWERMVELNGSCKPAGVYCSSPELARKVNEIGVPVTACFENAVAMIVLGDEWNTYTDAEIKKVISKQVLTDGRGLEILCERGFSDFCGGRVKAVYDNGMAERFGNHIFNGDFKNYYRDVFMNFTYYINNTGSAYELEPMEKAEVVSNFETISHNSKGCSLYIFEGAEGNRFAVDGYLFPNSIGTRAKKEQLGNVIDWLTGNRLPVRLHETGKIMPNVTERFNGDMNVVLTNASFDDSGRFMCTIRSEREMYMLNNKGELLPIEQRRTNEGVVVTIENIRAWEYIFLTNINPIC